MKWTNRESWQDLSQWFHSESPDFDKNVYRSLLPPDSAFDPGRAQIQFALSERPFLEEVVQAAMIVWPDPEVAFEGLSPQATELLRLRFQAAWRLTASLGLPSASWMPFPKDHMLEMVQWLLVDHWNAEGRPQAAIDYFVYWSQDLDPDEESG